VRLGVAGDHAGFAYKQELLAWLRARGHEVVDFGPARESPDDDFPDYVVPLARAVGAGEVERGIALCGSGVGACVAANKVAGVRASICHDAYSAAQGVEHDALNLLCLGARVISLDQARQLLDRFLAARFSGEPRHVRRVGKIAALEDGAEAGGGRSPTVTPGSRILAADVGGTRARLALFELDGQRALRLIDRAVYASADYGGLVPLVRAYLARIAERPERAGERPERACLAVAGPLRDGRGEFSNLDWKIDARELRRELGLERLELINDFAAIAYAVGRLEPQDRVVVHQGAERPGGPRAVLGPGTGLGTALAVCHGGAWRVLPSEAGHMDFGPRTALERGLLEFLSRELDHVSWERVVSGPGLQAIYRFLVETGQGREQPQTRRRLEREDGPAVISQLALQGADPLCAAALELFVGAYGAYAGNLALALGGRGEVYLGGGITPRILPKLCDGTFARAFRSKGRLSPLLEETPVYAIVREDVGLLGAASAAIELP
jgi:glucokinase